MPNRLNLSSGNNQHETPDTTASDATLLLRVEAGQDSAATAIYMKYAQRLLGLAKAKTSDQLASRFDPEDIVQSVFRTFFRRAAHGHYEVPEGGELWKLFLVIALNKIRRNAITQQADKRDIRRTHSLELFDGSNSPSPDDDTARSILKLTIEDLLRNLPSGHSAILAARMEGHDVADISRISGRSKRTVERILQEFRIALHREFEDS